MERRSPYIAGEVRVASKGGQKKIYGTAAVTYIDGDRSTEYDLESYGLPGVKERIMPGAFKRALGRSQGGTIDRKRDVYAAINHNPDTIFARTTAGSLRLSVDETGLHYEASPSDTTAGRDAVAAAADGLFGGSSFAFVVSPKGETWRKDGDTEVREIHRIDKVVDVSPVVTPAYQATNVTARSATETRASYDQWKQQLDQDFSNLHAIQDKLATSLQFNKEDEEAPEPVDGECPEGWDYDEETETCVMAEAAVEEDEEASRGQVMRAAAKVFAEYRHVVSAEADEEAGTLTVVYTLDVEPDEPAEEDELPADEEASNDKETNDRLRRLKAAELDV